MILLADSGSTKTQWSLVEYNTVKKNIETQGLNPYFVKSDTIVSVIETGLMPNLGAKGIKAIYFYGAGCSTEANNRTLRETIRPFFPDAEIHIHHDILGAARALHGDKEGIACILGTGSNCCYYDGRNVFTAIPSLGYLYGDEGAGSNIGKVFVGMYLKNKLPEDLRQEFDQTYHLRLEDILTSLYNRPSPNRFLASFSEFIAPRKDHPFLYEMVKSSFKLFVEENIVKYHNYNTLNIGFVGSIAWFYKDILRNVCNEFNLHTDKILRSPMERLITYHGGSE